MLALMKAASRGAILFAGTEPARLRLAPTEMEVRMLMMRELMRCLLVDDNKAYTETARGVLDRGGMHGRRDGIEHRRGAAAGQ